MCFPAKQVNVGLSVYLEGMIENLPGDSFSPEFKNITSRTARSGAMMLIAKCTRHGFAFLVYFLLLNLLVPSDFGLMKYITIVLGIINMQLSLVSIAIVQKPVLRMMRHLLHSQLLFYRDW